MNYIRTTIQQLVSICAILLISCLSPTHPIYEPIHEGGREITEGDGIAVSPDGEKLAFIRNSTFFICDTSGQNEVQVTEFIRGISTPCWSSDGLSLVYLQVATLNGWLNQINRVDISTGTVSQIPNADSVVANLPWSFSPNQLLIAFFRYGANSPVLSIQSTLSGEVLARFAAIDFAWAPNSNDFAALTSTPDDTTSLCIGTVGQDSLIVLDRNLRFRNIGWLSDGRTVLYTAFWGMLMQFRLDSLVQQKNVAVVEAYKPSPTALRIAYTDVMPSSMDLPAWQYLVAFDPSTGISKQLVRATGIRGFQWSPTSNHIFYFHHGSIYKVDAS